MSSRIAAGTVVLVAALIGLNFTILKYALDHTTPLMLAGMRTMIASTALLGFAFARGERLPTRAVDYLNIFIVGLSITTVSSALLVFGVNRVPSGFASLLSATMPLFTALLTLILLGTGLSRLGVAGLVIGFAGTALLASLSLSGSAQLIGIVALCASALAWAYGTVHMKWQDMSRVSPVMLVGVQLVFSAIMLVPFALIVEGTAQTEWTWGLMWPLLYSAIPSNAVTFALLATVVRHATPTVAASSAYMIPLFGVVFAWLIRDEALGWIELVGAALIVSGVYLVVTTNARVATKPLDRYLGQMDEARYPAG